MAGSEVEAEVEQLQFSFSERSRASNVDMKSSQRNGLKLLKMLSLLLCYLVLIYKRPEWYILCNWRMVAEESTLVSTSRVALI